MGIDAIGFDGDDTLWHTESIYAMTEERFQQILAPYLDAESLRERLFATEMRNLAIFGYGVKGFILSMIETALDVSAGRIGADQIQLILDAGRAMLEHPVEALAGAADALEKLSGERRLLLITKGDLFDQEHKLARSGLGDHFDAIAIVSEKDPATYRRVLAQHDVAPERFVMVGNSVKSDVAPVLELGARAVHVPYHVTWAHEQHETGGLAEDRLRTIESLAALPAALASLDQPAAGETGRPRGQLAGRSMNQQRTPSTASSATTSNPKRS